MYGGNCVAEGGGELWGLWPKYGGAVAQICGGCGPDMWGLWPRCVGAVAVEL